MRVSKNLRLFVLVNVVIALINGMCMGLLYRPFPIHAALLTAVAILHAFLFGCVYSVLSADDKVEAK